MAKTKNAPAIRAEGFTDPWEQRKLGELSAIKTGDSDLQDADPDGQYPFFVRSEEIERSNRYLYDGEAILVPGEGRLGEIFHYIVGKFDYHQRVYKISDFDDIDGKFIFHAMRHSFKEHALRNTVKATVDSIRLPTLTEFEFNAPLDFTEQHQIAEFFDRLDDLIALHKHKHERLKHLEEGMLQKMFPKPGQAVPEVRFEGFTGSWERRKLRDEVFIGNGRDYKHLEEGAIPVYGTGGYMLSVNEALSYDRDAIGIGRKGTIDKPYLLKAPFWTVDTLFYVIPNSGNDLRFMLGCFEKIDWRQKDESTGVPSLSKETIADTEIMLPDGDEQHTIGAFFTQLDSLIVLHQHKHERLKRLKKAMLQKMFA